MHSLRYRVITILLVVYFYLLPIPSLPAGNILFVGPEGSGHPYSSIQKAIEDATDGDTILVYPGLYRENILFLGKAITLLSHEGPEVTVIDGGKKGPVVIFNQNEGRDSVIDGFTITNGNGYWGAFGGGIFCGNSASPTIIHNIITGNSACYYGGGISCYYYSSPLISGNIIENNNADEHGGGIFSFYDSHPVITGNIIRDNYAEDYGGGICSFLNSNPRISDNKITGNISGRWGGGIFGYKSSPEIERNVITGNRAMENGGGISLDRSFSKIINSIISKNEANWGGGIWVGYDSGPSLIYSTMDGNEAIYGKEVWCGYRSLFHIRNSILWNSSPNLIYADSTSGFEISYSDIRGGFQGEGNMDQDPLFQNSEAGDYHLTALSPCIDRASPVEAPSEDFEGDSRPQGSGFDMGADEFRAIPCRGDFDSDGDVDGSDLAIFAADFGRTNCNTGPPCEGDFDSDGDVDGSDLAVFAKDFGRTNCPCAFPRRVK